MGEKKKRNKKKEVQEERFRKRGTGREVQEEKVQDKGCTPHKGMEQCLKALQ